MEEITLGIVVERIANLKEDNAKEHSDMLTQVTKTNGAVASLKLWRAYLTGALAVITAIVIPLAFMFLSNWLTKKI